jgi:CBS domain-containing protein
MLMLLLLRCCSLRLFSWMWTTVGAEGFRALLRGMRQRGSEDKHSVSGATSFTITTSSPRLRDEIQRAAINAGYSAHWSQAPSETSDDCESEQWAISLSPDNSQHGIVSLQTASRQPATEQQQRVWCVTVPHADHLMVVRRVLSRREEDSCVSAASLPVIVGNCEGSEGDKLGSASITYLSRRSPFRPVRRSSSLMDAAKALATQVHRVPVLDEGSKKCVYIISQSSIISFLIQHKAAFRDEWKQSIASLSLGLCQVISITTEATAWTAFKLLEVSGVSGVAVVDGSGKLVGNTSAKDLKLFMLDRGSLSLDQLIMEYLSAIRQREMQDVRHPSCSVQLSASIGHVIELMSATKYHRVFVVDKEARPIGVLSVTDILRFACADQATANHLQIGLARLSDEQHRGSLSGASGAAALSSFSLSPVQTPHQQQTTNLPAV